MKKIPLFAAALASGLATAPLHAADGKKTYDTVCVACHATGVGNAPKLGDKDAWKPRAATGRDALIKSVVAGKGVMPPKAGNPNLAEADIAAAVDYMLGSLK